MDSDSLGGRVLGALIPRHFPDLNAVHRASGIAYSTLHAWKKGSSEPHWGQVKRLAELVNVSPFVLALGPSTPSNSITLRQHPAWASSLIKAKERFRGLPDSAYELAGDTSAAKWPERIDEYTVHRLAEFWFNAASDRKLIDAEVSAARAEMAAEDEKRH